MAFLYIYAITMRTKITAFFILLTVFGFGQTWPLAKNAFMERNVQTGFDFWNISQPSTNFHSSFKPYLSSTFEHANDSAIPFQVYSFNNRFFQKSLGQKAISHTKSSLQLHPILDAQVGNDFLQKRLIYSGLAGLHIKTNINSNFTFALTLLAGKSGFPFFLDTSISKQNLIPEVGQAYVDSKNNYGFFDYNGYISFSPKKSKVFNLQLGRDKHVIGDGYRSVLYSDFGPATPYFGINTNIWRIQYNVWYSWMYDVTSANGFKNSYKNKYGCFHYLSYNILKELQIGFFDNIVWRGTDTNQVRTFEVNYLNPIIFLRPQEYSVGSPDNSFIGFNINVTLFKTLKFYGQLGLDEFYYKEVRAKTGWWGNKQAWQAGVKYIKAFGVEGLRLQLEYNQARPYTYTHGLVEQNYSHYGQPLAHPFGANFKEALGIVGYRKNKWELSWQGMYALIGKDSLSTRSNVGQNIFLSYNTRPFDYGHYTGQGIATTMLQSELKFSYFIIPDLNMRFELCYIQRSEKNTQNYRLESPYVFLSFKTSFWNSYRDF